MPKISSPLLVYDGDCSFCRLWIERWKPLTGDRVEYAPFQEAASRFPEIPLEQFKAAVQLIEPSGDVSSGAEAVFRLLRYSPGKAWVHWLYRHLPGASAVSEAFYRWVAAHRSFLYRLTRLLWGQHFERPSYDLTRWLFLRLLAVIYLIAFLSLHVQMLGLIGTRGVLPVSDFLQAVRESLGSQSYWSFPTLAWISPGDTILRVLSVGGILASLVALAGLVPLLAFATLWLLYLSLVIAGQDFLSFQWDILLLETGFLGIFFSPRRAPPSRTVLWLLRFLLFRLMFSSGAGKLASGDLTWRTLTALNYHYETQCLPTPLAWYMHQLPGWFQKVSSGFTLGTEILVPFLIFTPRRLRFTAAVLLIVLQVLIMLTGNYAFFNWLPIALCLLLFDDALFQTWRTLQRAASRLVSTLGRRSPDTSVQGSRVSPQQAGEPAPQARRALPRLVSILLAAALLPAGAIQVARMFWTLDWIPSPAARVLGHLTQLHVVGNYGLFTVMTTSRPEIVVEGSNDGQTWREYEFKYKPGDLKRRPPIVAPHQPRLDWQMWFAALGDYRGNPWFVNLMVRLLEGSPEVLALLERNPFPTAPPRYIRAARYDYHFTRNRTDGAWWRREFKDLYFPVASLK